MNQLPNPPETDPLEQAVRRAVAGLPPRRAPSTLEVRVRAAIAAREAGVRETRGFAAWPAPVRWLALSFLVAVAAWVVAALGGDAARGTLPAGSQALAGAAAMLIRAVPASWWYAALLAFAVWYAGVVGLGLTAYRLLRARD